VVLGDWDSEYLFAMYGAVVLLTVVNRTLLLVLPIRSRGTAPASINPLLARWTYCLRGDLS
jgi:hypothetical protein